MRLPEVSCSTNGNANSYAAAKHSSDSLFGSNLTVTFNSFFALAAGFANSSSFPDFRDPSETVAVGRAQLVSANFVYIL